MGGPSQRLNKLGPDHRRSGGCEPCNEPDEPDELNQLARNHIEAPPTASKTSGCPDVTTSWRCPITTIRDGSFGPTPCAEATERAGQSAVDQQVQAALAAVAVREWLPLAARTLDPETLAKVEPHARSAVEATDPKAVKAAHRMLRASFGITEWTLNNLGFLDTDTTWHPENVRVYVDEVNRHRSVHTRKELRWTLSELGRKNSRFWLPKSKSLTRVSPATPYDSTEEAALRLASLLKGEPGRPEELAVAGFSLGAGMNAPQMRLAMPGDVIDMGNSRVGIEVKGPHARLVPIRVDYCDHVVRAVEFAGDGPFFNAKSRNAVFCAAERVMVHGFGHLELPRARSTWLKAHLAAGTSLLALRVIAGPLSMNTLDGLIGAVSETLTARVAAVEGLRA